MSWNEPGGNNKDPWGNKNDQGPPDLDEVFKGFQDKLNSLFGGKGNNNGSGNSSNGSGELPVKPTTIAIILLILWLVSGFYIIAPAEKGVVTQFGRYVSTASSGPNWHVPFPIQTVMKIDVAKSQRANLNNLSMLTQDENIVDVELGIQYNIRDAKNFLFNVFDPTITVASASESAIRQVIGQNDMDVILTDGRSKIAQDVHTELQAILDKYNAGVNILNVNLQKAQAPAAVQAAFIDANKAREDEQRYINQAEAYRNEIVPLAKGEAKQEIEQAKGYKSRVTKIAEGETSRFLKVLEQYERAPEVTRSRLYIETLQDVLSKTNKVLIDSDGSNNMLYIPLDQIMKKSNDFGSSNTFDLPQAVRPKNQQSFAPGSTDGRSRDRGIR